jgi:hypothetical protein
VSALDKAKEAVQDASEKVKEGLGAAGDKDAQAEGPGVTNPEDAVDKVKDARGGQY